jgi:hypothetical protein
MIKHFFLKFSLLYENRIWVFLALRDLAVCMKTKTCFFFNVFTKTRYFNTECVFLRCKNTNQY